MGRHLAHGGGQPRLLVGSVFGWDRGPTRMQAEHLFLAWDGSSHQVLYEHSLVES